MGKPLGVNHYAPRVIIDPVEAVQLTNANMHEVAEWAKGRVYEETGDYSKSIGWSSDDNPNHYLSILSRYGVRKAKIGDYVVKKDGEFQPYPPEKFEKSYRIQTPGTSA